MNFVLTAIATKSGQVLVNAAKQRSLRAATLISTARPINTVAPKPKVNEALPTTYSYFQVHSPVKKLINKRTAVIKINFNKKINTAKVNNVTTAGPKAVGNLQYTLQHQGIFDSGCSRHMIGNKSFLTDYQDIDSGFVTFGGSPKGGKITGKGKIRTGKLDFEDVYFVKELKFNLFSISQMCDEKNSILFIETECLVLSPDFKLLDESQVLLKVPRQNNMYSFDLKNVVPLGVAERKNRTPTESTRTMLADSLLPIIFWAEAVNIACYVQNRVLVTKPHNMTPYELLHGRPPSISFMRPFVYPVTILNTLDPIGKFDRKTDEGFLVGYFINSKDFRVFNTRTRKVEENLHITFHENKPNVVRSGPDWLFDIDLLTNSMNYEPVTTWNQTISAAGQSFVNADDLSTDPFMPDLEDTTDLLNTGIFSGAYDDEDVGAEDNLNNLEITMNVSPIPTTKIHKDHPKDQIIGDINSATQKRRMTKIFEEHAMVSYINKQRRKNYKDYQNYLFACFFSQIEPKKVSEALTDPSWIEVMQDELLQFRLQKVWRLVDLPKGKHAIGTKWVYRNKKDKRVKQKDNRIFISQDKYVADILKKFDFVTVKTTSTPIKTNKALLKDEEAEDVDVHLYRLMIGSLMYLIASRPDIMFAMSACARFQVTPKVSHLHAVKMIFRYLKDGISDEFGVKTGSGKVNDARIEGNADFHQIVDFLNASTIMYSLTISPTICASYIKQFWSTTMTKIVNNEMQIHAKVDGKTIVISKSSVRGNLYFNDEDGVTSLTNSEILENLALMGYEIVYDKLTFQKAFFSPQ
ncbi:putative ribonuclease H-like domain-containing protein [Tanacetum coccineum]